MSTEEQAESEWDVCVASPRFDAAEACQLAMNLGKNCGYSVFPCCENKRPACPHGFKDGSKEADDIAGLWKRWPGPLIGVATGAVSGISALDIDLKHDEARAWWRPQATRLAATRAYRTRSGGVHLYFTHKDGIRCASGRPVPGVDVRGDGGYVIMWFAAGLPCLDHSPPAPWPEWLTREVWPPAKPAERPKGAPERNQNSAVAAIVRTVCGAAEGERNGKLFWAAHRLRERGIGRADAEEQLVDAARGAGLPELEARRTVSSAWRA